MLQQGNCYFEVVRYFSDKKVIAIYCSSYETEFITEDVGIPLPVIIENYQVKQF